MAKIEVSGQEFELIKYGRAQAAQVVALGQWLAQYGAGIMAAISEQAPAENDLIGGIQFLGKLLGGLTVDALLELYILALGCTTDFADENFDLAVLIDVVIKIYEGHDSIRRLVNRFFSTGSSSATTEEPSTKSE